MDYIIVQAGGKGTRLGYLTSNKPKAMTPVDNLPMLFHLFRKYPDKRYIIIGDYHKEVLREYLSAFADVKYLMVDADGNGTCGGLQQALALVPDREAFMLIWCDLLLHKGLKLPEEYEKSGYPKRNYVGIANDFCCRWSYKNDQFIEEPSKKDGVAGVFLFKDKSCLSNLPESGEFVRWMKDEGISFDIFSLKGTREFGTLEEYKSLENPKCRPFNRTRVEGGCFIKEAIDEQGKKLAYREVNWYKKAMELDLPILPQIYDYSPLKMEYIKGKNIYECNYEYDKKRQLLKQIVDSLHKLHESENVDSDPFSMNDAYYLKTMQRLNSVRDLVPFSGEKYVTVNGRKCRNVFFFKREFEKRIRNLSCDKFVFIHGDCTFSNIMVREDGRPILIDPRGYFGTTELFGDEMYDWGKLYYSLVGDYDQFNLKNFTLDIGGELGSRNSQLSYGEVHLDIVTNGWKELEEDFIKYTNCRIEDIKLIHAIIWLSLTSYAWQDYDSICGAFYNGLYYLEEVL